MSFATLKKQSSSNIERLRQAMAKATEEKGSDGDPRFWYPDVDKAGNGQAIIRFLPCPPMDDNGEGLPWAKIFKHRFKGPSGKWYSENSLTTLGQKDPVSEYNTMLWNTGGEDSSERKQAREQKRHLTYISNIYVISDPKNPENEGKVFLFRYGKKIYDKIHLLMHPEFEDDTPVNPFDLWQGANLRLKIRNLDGYRNYDQSVFEQPKPLKSNDKELEAIYNSEYSLKEFTDAKNFKTYDELKTKLHDVLELDTPTRPSALSTAKKAAAVKSQTKAEDEDESPFVEDDDDLADFRAMARG